MVATLYGDYTTINVDPLAKVWSTPNQSLSGPLMKIMGVSYNKGYDRVWS